MCFGCWAERDYPQIENAKVLAAVPLIAAVYAENCVGGKLHCALDDWNLDTEFFDIDNDDWTSAEIECASHMREMTEDERASALARYEGWEAEDAKAGQVEDENFAYGGPCPQCGKPWSGRCGAFAPPTEELVDGRYIMRTYSFGFVMGGHCVRVGNARNG